MYLFLYLTRRYYAPARSALPLEKGIANKLFFAFCPTLGNFRCIRKSPIAFYGPFCLHQKTYPADLVATFGSRDRVDLGSYTLQRVVCGGGSRGRERVRVPPQVAAPPYPAVAGVALVRCASSACMDACMDAWMDAMHGSSWRGGASTRVHGCVDGCVDGCVASCVDECVVGCL